MFRNLFGRKKPDAPAPAAATPALAAAPARREVPVYTALLETPSRTLPAALKEREASDTFVKYRDAWQQKLLGGTRPTDSQPAFASLVRPPSGVVTMTIPPEETPVALVFSSPLRAMDYRDAVGLPAGEVQLLALPLPGLVKMLRDLEPVGITRLAFDRCPRCAIGLLVDGAGISNVEKAWEMRCIHKATEVAREQLYFSYALDAARAGHLDEAREIALEAAGHVTLEDPNLHLLIGQIGVATGDSALATEAVQLLRMLGAGAHEAKLVSVISAARADFEGPAEAAPARR